MEEERNSRGYSEGLPSLAMKGRPSLPWERPAIISLLPEEN